MYLCVTAMLRCPASSASTLTFTPLWARVVINVLRPEWDVVRYWAVPCWDGTFLSARGFNLTVEKSLGGFCLPVTQMALIPRACPYD